VLPGFSRGGGARITNVYINQANLVIEGLWPEIQIICIIISIQPKNIYKLESNKIKIGSKIRIILPTIIIEITALYKHIIEKTKIFEINLGEGKGIWRYFIIVTCVP